MALYLAVTLAYCYLNKRMTILDLGLAVAGPVADADFDTAFRVMRTLINLSVVTFVITYPRITHFDSHTPTKRRISGSHKMPYPGQSRPPRTKTLKSTAPSFTSSDPERPFRRLKTPRLEQPLQPKHRSDNPKTGTSPTRVAEGIQILVLFRHYLLYRS